MQNVAMKMVAIPLAIFAPFGGWLSRVRSNGMSPEQEVDDGSLGNPVDWRGLAWTTSSSPTPDSSSKASVVSRGEGVCPLEIERGVAGKASLTSLARDVAERPAAWRGGGWGKTDRDETHYCSAHGGDSATARRAAGLGGQPAGKKTSAGESCYRRSQTDPFASPG